MDPSIQYQAGFLAFTKAKGESYKQLAADFSKALKQLKAADTYSEIIDKYLDAITKASF